MTNTTVDGGWEQATGPSQRFTDSLDELREAGCVVLVTGDVDETVQAAISRRLFGASELPRQRVIVYSDDGLLSPSSYLPHGTTPESVQCLEWTDGLRCDAEASRGEGVFEYSPHLAVYSQQLAGVLADTARMSGKLSPGELRVGILTLDLILGRYGQTATAAFLAALGQRMKAFHGMGHCHLPVSSESTVATTLASGVDIHIRLRDRDGNLPEQCWCLCKTDCCSTWMSLDL